ncbi:MAG: 7-cyano-7-deazaguanine synthase QueC [bacterium]
MKQAGNSAAPGAVVLLSGGIDSTTTLAIARSQGYETYAISFQYGQRNRCELQAAKRIAQTMGTKKHIMQNIDLSAIGGSALTTKTPVPKGWGGNKTRQEIPVTYVPARNLIFLSLGLAWAESLHVSDLFIGVNARDYSGYPDCRPEFIDAFQKTADLATKAGVSGKPFRIRTPLIRMTKSQIIRKGTELGVDYSLTQSCYDPATDGNACGECDSCIIRKKGFEEAGVPDPTCYSGLLSRKGKDAK